MLTQEDVQEILAELNVVLVNKHFVYTSGKHGSAYVNKDGIYPHTMKLKKLCGAIAWRFRHDNIQTVVSPAVGGVALCQWVAQDLTERTGDQVFAVYAEKVEGTKPAQFQFNRGYAEFVRGKRVLVVEDILNTGGSAHAVINAVRDIDGVMVAAAALVNRGGVTKQDLVVPELYALVDVKLEAFEEADCPLCKQGVPIETSVGKGKEFLAKQTK